MMTKAYFVAGLGYGDEGKGTIVDFLAQETGSGIVVRYSGGPQAAHHVVQNGFFHCFSQFGSGTFAGAETYLSRYMLIDPLALVNEKEVLEQKGIKDAYKKLTIDPDCVVVTPIHKIVGQMRELVNKHGSCGMGVGETVRDSKNGNPLRIKDLLNRETLEQKLDFIWRVKLDQAEQLADQNPNDKEMQERYEKIKQKDFVSALLKDYSSFIANVNVESLKLESAVFEGSQGVLLDKDYGFWPHVTKTKTTFDNAYELADGADVRRIGVIRAYMTRHGAGPFVTHDEELTERIPDIHNGDHEWQGPVRVGWLDLVAAKYAIKAVGGVDRLAITNLDRLNGLRNVRVCAAYEYMGRGNIDDFFDYRTMGGRRIIYGIKVQKNPTHAVQEQLKNHIVKCRPNYTEFHGWRVNKNDKLGVDVLDFLSFIESKLQVPISILSLGPRKEDKRIYRGY